MPKRKSVYYTKPILLNDILRNIRPTTFPFSRTLKLVVLLLGLEEKKKKKIEFSWNSKKENIKSK